MHPLFRINDGQDALILAHSKAVARPKSLVAVEPLSQYERDGFDGRLGKTSAQWWMDREYRQRCAAFHAAPGKNASAPPPHTYLGYAYTTSKVTHFADFGAADCSQVSNASALQVRPVQTQQADASPAVAEAPQADTRPLLKWISCLEIPQNERGGLWFMRMSNGEVKPARFDLLFNSESPAYLRAAPGVREGDAFDANLYRNE